jgi:hypothetical protein
MVSEPSWVAMTLVVVPAAVLIVEAGVFNAVTAGMSYSEIGEDLQFCEVKHAVCVKPQPG